MFRKTDRFLWIMILLAILFSSGVPARFSAFRGFYQYGINLIYCNGESDVCRHEIGHMIDQEMGYPSRTAAFGEATFLYLHTQLYSGGTNDITNAITSTPGIVSYSELYKPLNLESFSSPQEEMYASIYAAVDGDISKLPPVLKPFFKDGKEYDEIHSYLLTHKIYIKEITQ